MITSTANAQVKALSKLIKNARARRQQQLYVVEGIRMFRETPKERIGKVYVSESFAKDPAHEGVFEGTDWEMLSDSVFAAVSDTKTPQGVLCLLASYIRIPAAMAAFSDSSCPPIGIRI